MATTEAAVIIRNSRICPRHSIRARTIYHHNVRVLNVCQVLRFNSIHGFRHMKTGIAQVQRTDGTGFGVGTDQ